MCVSSPPLVSLINRCSLTPAHLHFSFHCKHGIGVSELAERRSGNYLVAAVQAATTKTLTAFSRGVVVFFEQISLSGWLEGLGQ